LAPGVDSIVDFQSRFQEVRGLDVSFGVFLLFLTKPPLAAESA
jgi:hypothetical protein